MLVDQFCRTHSVLDIQGHEREVRDALGRTVMRYGFAMCGGQVSRAGMDTGGGQVLPDITGKPVYARNSRGFVLRTDYDALRRPVRVYVAGPGIAGEALAGPDRLRGVRRRPGGQEPADPGGPAVRRGRDRGQLGLRLQGEPARLARGNSPLGTPAPSSTGRRRCRLRTGEYTSSTRYDALNRPVALTTPDGSVRRPSL